MRTILATISAAVFLALGAPSAHAVAERAPHEANHRVCPEVAVVAARGSEQNMDLEPTRYVDGSIWESNGYEASVISALLTDAEARHVDATGESLLRDVPVLALDESVYPAALPLPVIVEEGEEIAALELASRVNRLLRETPLPTIAEEAATGFLASMRAGVNGTVPRIQEWEKTTGCAPQYLLVGYSQGALVLTAQEQELAEAGRLAGVLYLGNPLLTPDDPSAVGGAASGGLLRAVPAEVQRTASGVPRINYCLAGDFVCDTSLDALTSAASHGGVGRHEAYFTAEDADATDAVVAERFASWILQAQGR